MTTEPSSRSPAGAPRTLAETLRDRPDDVLCRLLSARPDLLSPVPGDLTQLATRAGTRASVVRALERLDRFALRTAEALAVAPDPCPYPTLAALLPGEDCAAALPHAIAVLRDRAVVWGDDDRLRLVRTARELLAPAVGRPSPTGLGPTLVEATGGMSPGRLQRILAADGLPGTHDPVSAVAALTELFTDPDRMAALLSTAPQAARAVLERLVWGPPYGEASPDRPSEPIAWLLEHGLLLPAGGRTVVLPREVALHLRGGRAHRDPEPLPPAVSPQTGHPQTGHPPHRADGTAAGAAFSALVTVEELLTLWETSPPPVLRAGGLGVRELKRTAVALDAAEPVAAFWIELAYAAGLLASDGETDERYAPTPAADEWLHRPPEQRWAQLVAAWLAATRTPGLVGGRDSRGRSLAALGSGLDRSVAPEVRRRVLELLAALPEGGAPGPGEVLARLAWERPLRVPEELRSRLVEWTLAEAELLGVTGRGALASFARALLPLPGPATTAPGTAEDTAWSQAPTRADAAAAAGAAAERLVPLLPQPVGEVLLQADLTAVAPGPLRRPLARMLALLADVESKGAATVYRFSAASVRRALDAGHTAAELHTFLAEHSRTPVPQPLSYLIDDAARRHGRLRVGAASAYLRCDDDALLTEILADRRSTGMGLRRLAPTVLAASSSPETVLARLREMGYAPVAESAAGDVLISRTAAHRTPPRAAPEPVPDGPPAPDAALVARVVRAIRAGDRTAAAGGGRSSTAEPDGTDGLDGAGGLDGTGADPVAQTAADQHPAGRAGARSAARSQMDGTVDPGGPLPRTPAAETLAAVQSAALAGTTVCVGYVNADGAASRHVLDPLRVEGGLVTAYDHTVEEVRTYPLHRITGAVEPADEGS